MWKTLGSTFARFGAAKCLLNIEPVTKDVTRNTFILKRRWPPGLHKNNTKSHKLRGRNFVYDLVEDTNLRKKEDLELILTSFVDGLGSRGDIVKVKPNYAYNKLLLPKLAVYKTPENLQKYSKDVAVDEEVKEVHSSPYAAKMVENLSTFVLSVIMNKETPWRIEPWHIRASFRKASYHVPEDAITMPERSIEGPDLNKEGKQFYVTVTINGLEQVKVRCQLHHWSTDITERLPYVNEFWNLPIEPIFSEDAQVLNSMPVFKSNTATNTLS